jgi:lysophospholipase L1-like esterase
MLKSTSPEVLFLCYSNVMMTQVFILGSSMVYGVGGSHGGWADLIKQHLHQKMYGDDALGEKYEIYNFGKSGATIDFVKDTFMSQLGAYGRKQKTVIVLAVGGNNTKAEEQPDNFVSTPEEYEKEMRELLALLKENSDGLIFVGSNNYVDETKTNPKRNPLTGGRSYFTNSRRQKFAGIVKQICADLDVTLVDVTVEKEKWLSSYIYKDGLHPNDAGHQLIFEAIKPALDKHL